jgi:small subunit ribosomal protein S6
MPFCYETIYILMPDLDDEAVEAAKGRVNDAVTAAGGRIYRRESWGRKRLAYTVAKQQRGNYQLIQYIGDGALVAGLERMFRLDDAFIKFLTIKLRRDPATVGDEATEEAAREAEAAAARDRDRDRGPRGGRGGRGGGGRGREREEREPAAKAEPAAGAESGAPDKAGAEAAPAAAE